MRFEVIIVIIVTNAIIVIVDVTQQLVNYKSSLAINRYTGSRCTDTSAHEVHALFCISSV